MNVSMITISSVLQAMYDAMIEVAFPVCAIIKIPDTYARDNTVSLSHLTSGVAHLSATGRGWRLIAGSTGEGLALGQSWGHERQDVDGMYLFGSELGVCLSHGDQLTQQKNQVGTSSSSSSPPSSSPPSSSSPLSSPGLHGRSCLVYIPKGCHPAYTRLRVSDIHAFTAHPCIEADCILESDGHHWLLPTRLNKVIQRHINQSRDPDPANRSTAINGPAGQARGGWFDIVPCLVANLPHPAIYVYLNRARSTEWPSQDQLQQIRQLPMCLVLVGHKESPNTDQEARISWSPAEIVLISKLSNSTKQGYIAFKYVFKLHLKIHRVQNKSADDRSNVCSYHLKNTFLYHLEKTPHSKISSPYGLMIGLFHDLLTYLNNGELPHYFLPECNLLATVGYNERQIAIQTIHGILLNPISAVLKCPSVPTDIYGEICPDDLVTAFSRVSIHPSCERSWQNLLLLLSRLDEWREQRYREQLVRDGYERFRVLGRPKLRGLVDILAQTKLLE